MGEKDGASRGTHTKKDDRARWTGRTLARPLAHSLFSLTHSHAFFTRMRPSFIGRDHYYRLPTIVVAALLGHSRLSLSRISFSSLIGMAEAAASSSPSPATAPAKASAQQPSEPHHPSFTRTVQCQCGKVHLQIHDDNPLRFVCYCRDCRGYYQTLNQRAAVKATSQSNANEKAAPGPSVVGKPSQQLQPMSTTAPVVPSSPALLDAWGGCDYTHLVNCGTSLRIEQGLEHVSAAIIRPNSPIRRVYANCCFTPLFSVGSTNTCLLNTHLKVVSDTNADTKTDDAPLPPIRFRILGRQALSGGSPNRPSMSWSVPLAWFWTMPRRIPPKGGKDDVPLPLQFPPNLPVMEDFREG